MICSIIPARGGSKGFPKKNVAEFCGKPLIAWSIEQAIKSKYIEDTYVSSDDKEILKISKAFGAKAIQRPESLARDDSLVEEALLHALEYIQKYSEKEVSIVVFLQPTSPVRTARDIDRALELFKREKADSLFSAAVLDDFCAWKITHGNPVSVTYDYKNRGRRQDRVPYYLENGSIYIFRPEVIKKFKNRLGGKIIIFPMPSWKSYEIDKFEDLEICEYFMKKNILVDFKECDSEKQRL